MSKQNAIRLPSPAALRGFTLVELLVVIGIIALLLSILLPALGNARAQANRAFCLNNIRNMQLAQVQYYNDNRGYLVQAGLSHRGVAGDESVAWINTLQQYYSGSRVAGETTSTPSIAVRCPSDLSPHWPGGSPVPLSNPQAYRRTSYGINIFLDRDLCPWGPGQSVEAPAGGWYSKITRIRRPSNTIQFLEMAYTGEFAGADHPHVENWVGSNPSAAAATMLQTAAHGGRARTFEAISNYGFLDGHAESLRFGEVFRDLNKFNRFDPALAR